MTQFRKLRSAQAPSRTRPRCSAGPRRRRSPRRTPSARRTASTSRATSGTGGRRRRRGYIYIYVYIDAHLPEHLGHREEISARDELHVDADIVAGVRERGIVAEHRYVFRKICVNSFHRPVRAHNDAVGVEVVRLPVEYELITVLKSLCFVQERRVAERAVLTHRIFRGCPPSYSAAHSAGYSAGFRAHSVGTKSQQHAHICIQNSLSAMLITTEAEAGGGG